jgi:RimJ/RimL family protein N-acetyltransferase
MTKAHKIITERAVIRRYEITDAWMLKKTIDENLEHLRHWMPWVRNEPETLKAKLERVQNFRDSFYAGTDATFAVLNHGETELLGSTGLHPRITGNAREIGYWLAAPYTGKGLATEIVRALLKTGFEIELLDRIEIRCDVKNKASIRIAEKCGFELKEILKANMKDSYGNDRDTMIWEITATTYAATAQPGFDFKAFDAAGKEIEI